MSGTPKHSPRYKVPGVARRPVRDPARLVSRHLVQQQRLQPGLPYDVLAVPLERFHFGDQRKVDAAGRTERVHRAPVFVEPAARPVVADEKLEKLAKRRPVGWFL